jgi:glycerol-3-phosphate acyltransferase PlsY
VLTFLALLVASYLIGAIPFAFIIAKRWAGIDIREHGSGNVGATNVLRVVGVKAGLVCLAFDFLKGFVPAVLAIRLLREPAFGPHEITLQAEWFLVGAMAIVGHCFPVYLMSVGGKGIATSLGVFTVLMPVPTLICFVVGLALIFSTGYVALASVLCSILIPILAWVRHYPPLYLWVGAAVAVMIALRHQSNIRRLLKGTEPKVWEKAKAKMRDEGVGGS